LRNHLAAAVGLLAGAEQKCERFLLDCARTAEMLICKTPAAMGQDLLANVALLEELLQEGMGTRTNPTIPSGSRSR
jgi:hypothetical protein